MADWLRQLLYPLVLPVIVGTVWLCGWVRQQDDRATRGQLGLPPSVRYHSWAQQQPTDGPALMPPPPRSDFFAAAEAEEVGEEP